MNNNHDTYTRIPRVSIKNGCKGAPIPPTPVVQEQSSFTTEINQNFE